MSAPGAGAQIVHADTDFAPGPGLLHTTFVALQPVTRALGPTRFLPGTHATRAPHEALEAMGDVTGLRRTRDAPPPPSLVSLLRRDTYRCSQDAYGCSRIHRAVAEACLAAPATHAARG